MHEVTAAGLRPGSPRKRLVLYDVSRLVARRNAKVATGIDRVDLRFAVHLLHKPEFDAEYVAQWEGELRLLPRRTVERFLTELDRVWFKSQKQKHDFTGDFRSLGVLGHSAPGGSVSTGGAFKFITEKDYYEVVGATRQQRYDIFRNIDWNKFVPKKISIFGRVFNSWSYIPAVFLSRFPSVLKPFTRFERSAAHQSEKGQSKKKISPEVVARVAQSGSAEPVYVNCSHHGLLDQQLFAEIRMLGAKFLFYVHDIIPIQFPEYCKPGTKADHIKRMENVNVFSDVVLFNSRYSERAFLEYIGGTGRFRSDVAYIGYDAKEHQGEAQGLRVASRKPYFVMIGTIEGRKNHLAILQVWRSIAEETGEAPILYIFGKRGWACESTLYMLDHCDAIRPYVIEVNDATDRQMFRRLAGARALLMPTFLEGWGMPIVEAQTLGVPVVCSDIPVCREASDGRAIYIDPIDLKGWQKTIIELTPQESERRNEIRSGLDEYRPPKWEDAYSVLEERLTFFE